MKIHKYVEIKQHALEQLQNSKEKLKSVLRQMKMKISDTKTYGMQQKQF